MGGSIHLDIKELAKLSPDDCQTVLTAAETEVSEVEDSYRAGVDDPRAVEWVKKRRALIQKIRRKLRMQGIEV
jgi:hypothetical protein